MIIADTGRCTQAPNTRLLDKNHGRKSKVYQDGGTVWLHLNGYTGVERRITLEGVIVGSR